MSRTTSPATSDAAAPPVAYGAGSVALTSQAIAPLLTAAGVVAGARVLDVACGAGRATAAAADRGAVACGVDLSPAQVGLACDAFPALRFATADAAALPFDGASFDAVIANFGVPHFADPAGFLAEAWRVLRPGGRLAFTAWVEPGDAARGAGPDGSLLPRGFFDFGDPVHGAAMLRAAGFADIAIATVPIVWRPPALDPLIDIIIGGLSRAATLSAAPALEAAAALRHALRATIDADVDAAGLGMPAILASARKG